MVESLFNDLGLNKTDGRELVDLLIEELMASLAVGSKSNFPVSGILIFGIKTNVQAETQKLVRAFRFPHDVW